MFTSHRVTGALKRLTGLAGLGVLALGSGFGQPAHAQGAVAGYTGSADSSVAGCPWLAWRLARMANGDVSGFAYYSDASGVSEVSGTSGNAPGQLRLVLTSIHGKGPTGTVDVIKSPDGKLMAKLTGEGCANMEVPLRLTPNLNAVNEFHSKGG